jgi:hypothetical protein
VEVSAVFPKLTVDAGVKLVPSTVIVRRAELTLAESGETEVTDGRGYDNETAPEPEAELLTWLVAVTVTVEEPEGTMVGAV